jgi:hypothetical protein
MIWNLTKCGNLCCPVLCLIENMINLLHSLFGAVALCSALVWPGAVSAQARAKQQLRRSTLGQPTLTKSLTYDAFTTHQHALTPHSHRALYVPITHFLFIT